MLPAPADVREMGYSGRSKRVKPLAGRTALAFEIGSRR
jgi:hypothetical protein